MEEGGHQVTSGRDLGFPSEPQAQFSVPVVWCSLAGRPVALELVPPCLALRELPEDQLQGAVLAKCLVP